MNELTFEERNLMCLYNKSGTRAGLIAELTKMRGYLESDEAELRRMTDADYEALDLYPDFDPEDSAYGE